MTDREGLAEAALDAFPQGIALLDSADRVVYWNRVAEQWTGFPAIDVVARAIPGCLEPLLTSGSEPETEISGQDVHGRLVRAEHKLGHDLYLALRSFPLRDDLGSQIGTAIVFHLADAKNRVPAVVSQDGDLQGEVTNFEERVEEVYCEAMEKKAPLGLVWMLVDQAHDLRRTHGTAACRTMLHRMVQTLSNGLRPSEEIGLWGEDEFLVVSQEPTAERLAAHAQVLAGLARTANFRWWGDRLSLTLSVGAAFALPGEPLSGLLERARAALWSSCHGGGNRITLAPGRSKCLPL